jgi:hypothetical protein
MTTERAPALIRIERFYPLPTPGGVQTARRVNRESGRLEIALFGPDGREIDDLESVKRAFARIDEEKIEASFRIETWIAERHHMRCRVVRTIDEEGRREIVEITALNGDSPGPMLVPDPPNRALWARVIELSVPDLQRATR